MGQRLQSLRFRLTKRFGAKTVLDNFALEVRGREFITVLGPSGCGKSTALNILAGLVPATAGDVWVDDVRVDHVPPERRGFGMVFQNYALFPHLTVFENVAFGLRLRGRAKTEIVGRVHRILELVRLTGFEDRHPGQLSGGQQQRVAIARALVIEPRLLLLDEPLSNLDAKLRLEMRAEIKRLHVDLGLTSIYVTHDQTEALSLSDRVVVLRNGRVMQAGTPVDIHDQPHNVFVADFMGYHNFFPILLTEVRADGTASGRDGPLALTGRATPRLRPGERAVAAIRPEDVALTTDADGTNVVRGTVRLTEYLGREHTLDIALDSGASLTARVAEPVKVGTVVCLRLPAHRVVVLRADDSVA